MGLEHEFDIVAIALDQAFPEHENNAVTGRLSVRVPFQNVKVSNSLHIASPKIRKNFSVIRVQLGYTER